MSEAIGCDAAPDLARLARPGRHAFRHVVARLADGTELALPVVVITGGTPGPCLFAVAGVHGDEPQGVVALQDALGGVNPADLRGTVVAIPVANPPAFRAGQRRSPLDDLDLNRTFPGDPTGSPSQRLAHALLHDYALKADFVLSMHSWGSRGLVVPYVEYPAGESVAEVASLAAARALGLAFCRQSRWHSGLLVACAVQRGVPAVETEVGGLGIARGPESARYREAFERLLTHLGLRPGAGLSVPEAARHVRHLEVTAPVGGVLRPARDLGAAVRSGEVIATIDDLHGRRLVELASPVRGVVAAYRLCSSVGPGEAVATVFEDLAEADRAHGALE
jgi:uncharacterized protein